MKEVTKPNVYTDTQHEEYLNRVEKELKEFAEIEGRQNGEKNRPLVEPEFKAMVCNRIETTIQKALDYNQNKWLHVSGMSIVHTLRNEAKDKIGKLDAGIKDAEHTLQKLEEQKKQCTPDLGKRRTRKIILIFAALVGVADGAMAYDSLRYAGLSKFGSFITAVAIAIAIVGAIHIMGGYIARASTRQARITRLAITLVIAFIGFYLLNNLRANGYAEAARLDISTNTEQVQNTATASTFILTAISFALFAVVLLFAIKYAKDDTERKQEQNYDALNKEIADVKGLIEKNKKEIAGIEKDTSEKSADALNKFEYALSCERRLTVIAKHILTTYIEHNIRHRSDLMVPPFFAELPEFQFTLSFNNQKNTTHEN